MTDSHILVLCDRCRAEGTNGLGDFSHLGDLLDFEPAPRIFKRQDGWTPAMQRRFIAKLSETGSPTLAAEALGKNRHGVEKVYKAKGAEGFRAAWDKAVAMAEEFAAAKAEAGHVQLSVMSVSGVDLRRHGRARPEPEPAAPPEPSYEDKVAVFHSIYCKYMIKVEQEREARLAGRIVAADFTLRQLTCIEVMLDLMALKLESNGWEMLRQARMGKHGPIQIAETDMSRCLDAARREVWAEMEEPDRPEHPPRRYLEGYVGYSTEPTDALHGGTRAEQHAEIAARDQRYREDAAAQVAWERQAVEEWLARDWVKVEKESGQAQESEEGDEG